MALNIQLIDINMHSKSYAEIFYVSTKNWLGETAPIYPEEVRQKALGIPNMFPKLKNVLYLHFPFCVKRCDYCIYYSSIYDRLKVERYLEALEKEIRLIRSTEYIRSTEFQCVYFGGGTPSLLEEDQIRRIMDLIHQSFNLDYDVEVTFEANPSTLNSNKIKILQKSGFNRVSLGIQSFQNELLRRNNCNHTVEKAWEITNLLLEKKFVINIDMLFGLEHQSETDLIFELSELCKIQGSIQLSLFPLRILPSTPLYQKIKLDFDRQSYSSHLIKMDQIAHELLTGEGYVREEIPIFYYKKGAYAHIYNSAEARIIGLGPSAGTVMDRGIGVNYSEVAKYCAMLEQGRSPNHSKTFLTEQQNFEKFIFNRILFMNRSLPEFKSIISQRFKEYFNQPIRIGLYEKVVNDMIRKKYIYFGENGVIRFTNRFERILDKFTLGAPSII